MIGRIKYYILILSIFPVFIFSGCEKEIGDVNAPESISPFEGPHVFTVAANLVGQKQIQINNRGNFSFFIQLNPPQSIDPFPVIITGFVTDDGNLSGNIYKFQTEIGTISGQLGYGNFYFNFQGFIVQGTYSVT